MAPRTFERSICCENNYEDPTLIDGSVVCEECLKTAILPLFSNALEHEHNYPPKWGPIKLEVDDFAVLLTRHLRGRFLNRYHRREKEYQAAIRVYCKHNVDQRDVRRLVTSARRCRNWLLHQMYLIHIMQLGFAEDVTDESAAPVSSQSSRSRETTPTSEVLGQKRGRDLQQCPNNACRNILGLSAGCNHMTCNRCGTHFCFICGQEIDPDGDHFVTGKPCPRYNQPGSENALFDEFVQFEIPPDEFEDFENVDELMFRLRLRFVALRRLNDGGGLDMEWLLEVLKNISDFSEWDEERLNGHATHIFPSLWRIQPMPPRVPGEVIRLMTVAGIDEAAIRFSDWITSNSVGENTDHLDGPGMQFYEELVRDIELRELPEFEYDELRESLSVVWVAVAKASAEGLFTIGTINRFPEVSAWATTNGYKLEDEAV